MSCRSPKCKTNDDAQNTHQIKTKFQEPNTQKCATVYPKGQWGSLELDELQQVTYFGKYVNCKVEVTYCWPSTLPYLLFYFDYSVMAHYACIQQVKVQLCLSHPCVADSN